MLEWWSGADLDRNESLNPSQSVWQREKCGGSEHGSDERREREDYLTEELVTKQERNLLRLHPITTENRPLKCFYWCDLSDVFSTGNLSFYQEAKIKNAKYVIFVLFLFYLILYLIFCILCKMYTLYFAGVRTIEYLLESWNWITSEIEIEN